MCFLIKCTSCNKTTWKGCGKHIKDLAKKVPESDRCKCKNSNKWPK